MKHNPNHAYELGDAGEQAVADILRGRGYHVEADSVGTADMVINCVCTTEVKTAKVTGRTDRKAKRWQFSLFGHRESQRPFEEDLLILRCETTPPCHFVIPGRVVPRHLTKIDITTEDPHRYRGKWSPYRERWDLVDTALRKELDNG